MKKSEITIGSKVKHIPSGDVIIVKSLTNTFINGVVKDQEQDWMCDKSVKVRITECESYIEPPKEKSFYEKMKERNMEDAKKLSPAPKDVDQHILWLKMAVIDRVEKIENLTNDKICTFRQGEKFGFTEEYVNLLMHYAYEAGKKNATESLTRSFESTTKGMKNVIDVMIKALDDNDLLPDTEDNGW